jgi:hypothetical protein
MSMFKVVRLIMPQNVQPTRHTAAGGQRRHRVVRCAKDHNTARCEYRCMVRLDLPGRATTHRKEIEWLVAFLYRRLSVGETVYTHFSFTTQSITPDHGESPKHSPEDFLVRTCTKNPQLSPHLTILASTLLTTVLAQIPQSMLTFNER